MNETPRRDQLVLGSAPKEIDRADVLAELRHCFELDDPNDALAWALDKLAYLDILRFRPSPLCGVREGMTGIACQLPKGHILTDESLRLVHEGTTTVEQTTHVGYKTFVRWPLADTSGTPAAEAEQADTDRDSLPDWERDLVVAEYQKRQQESLPCPVTPRRFSALGNEPPADAKAVELLEPVSIDYRYLRRVGQGWLWSRRPHEQDPKIGATPNSWASAVRARHGMFQEVLP